MKPMQDQYSFNKTYVVPTKVCMKPTLYQYSFYETYAVPVQFLWNVRSTNIVSMAALHFGHEMFTVAYYLTD